MFNLVIMYFHCEVKVSTQINGKELLHRKMQNFSTCGGLLRTFRVIFLTIQNIYVSSNPDMKLKLIKDEDGNPEALLTDLFEPHDYQKHDSVTILQPHDCRMSSLRLIYNYRGKRKQSYAR